jgi:hypothetical protein
MKISYEAMCKQATIKEHFINSILHVYTQEQKKSNVNVLTSDVEKVREQEVKNLFSGNMNLK